MKLSQVIIGVTTISLIDLNACSDEHAQYNVEVGEFFTISDAEIDPDEDIELQMEILRTKENCANLCLVAADYQILSHGLVSSGHDLDQDIHSVNHCSAIFDYESIVELKRGDLDLGTGGAIGAVQCSIIVTSSKVGE